MSHKNIARPGLARSQWKYKGNKQSQHSHMTFSSPVQTRKMSINVHYSEEKYQSVHGNRLMLSMNIVGFHVTYLLSACVVFASYTMLEN